MPIPPILRRPKPGALLKRRRGTVSSPPCYDDRGTAALEFAIILPLFLGLVFMILQLALVFAAQELMDNAAHNAARLMRIGTYTGSDYADALTSGICNDLSPSGVTLIKACSSTIQIYVAAAPSGAPAGTGFTLLSPASVTNGTMSTGKASLNGKYDVLLQIGYNYPWFIALPTSGSTLLIATTAFQTEAY